MVALDFTTCWSSQAWPLPSPTKRFWPSMSREQNQWWNQGIQAELKSREETGFTVTGRKGREDKKSRGNVPKKGREDSCFPMVRKLLKSFACETQIEGIMWNYM